MIVLMDDGEKLEMAEPPDWSPKPTTREEIVEMVRAWLLDAEKEKKRGPE